MEDLERLAVAVHALPLHGPDAEVAELLAARGLPQRVDGIDVGSVLALVERDKKRGSGAVPFVLVEAPGKVTPGHSVPESELRAAVEEVCAA